MRRRLGQAGSGPSKSGARVAMRIRLWAIALRNGEILKMAAEQYAKS